MGNRRAGLTLILMSTPLPIAHESWFDSNRFALDWGFAGQRLTLTFLALALVVTIAVRALARVKPGVDVPVLGALAPYMPFAVRLHLAVSLVGLLSMGTYLSPAMHLPNSIDGWVLGITMAVVAVLMATGFRARWAAALLIAAGPLGMLEFGVSPVLQRADVLGLALFVLVAGAGRWSADYEQGRAGDPSPAGSAAAIWSLRVAAGSTLIVVAFVEKLANPKLALDFLAEHPQFNVAQEVGIHMTDLQFVRMAGAIEVLFGLLVISGALPQLCVLVVGIPFNATLYFFGTEELLGHLPIYAAMLVLLVYGSHPQLRPLVSALRIPAQARGALPALKAALQP
jgi:uncharacterized membrane protein YphA (DoxX/SURF4 family)